MPAKLQAAVVLNPGYSSIPPIFRLCLNWKGEKTNSNDDNIRVRPTCVSGGTWRTPRKEGSGQGCSYGGHGHCFSPRKGLTGLVERAQPSISWEPTAFPTHQITFLAGCGILAPLQGFGSTEGREGLKKHTETWKQALWTRETLAHLQTQHAYYIEYVEVESGCTDGPRRRIELIPVWLKVMVDIF